MNRGLVMGMLLCGTGPSTLHTQTPELSRTDYVDRALELAGDEFLTTAELQCGLTEAGALEGIDREAVLPPTRIADDFHYVGLSWVGAYALKTDEGLVLIDTLSSADEVRDVIIPGLAAFDVAPEDIRKIITTHQHFDRYGGAKFLQDNHDVEVIASAAAWEGMETGTDSAMRGEKPVRDVVIEGEVTISLGGTDVEVLATPGHTPGTVSLIVPVTVDGEPHTLAMWGGTGLPSDLDLLESHVASLDAFDEPAVAAGVDMIR